MLDLFDVVNLNKEILQESVVNAETDFEDSVIYNSAMHANIDVIITRDLGGFKNASLKVMLPHAFLIS